jgi:hypothetical protein
MSYYPSTVTFLSEFLAFRVYDDLLRDEPMLDASECLESHRDTECKEASFYSRQAPGDVAFLRSFDDCVSHPASYRRTPCQHLGFEPFPREVIP